MLIILVIMNNKIIPNALIDGGLRVNIITNALKGRLGLKKMEPVPFVLKIANPKKVMPNRVI